MKALVVVASGLQLGYVGCYGNDWISTPALDRLAAEGVVFDQHIADRPDADAARRVWRSGRFLLSDVEAAAEGGLRANEDLIHLLRKRGVWTSLLLDASQPCPGDFVDGWDEIRGIRNRRQTTALEEALEAFPDALDRLAEQESWLLWLDLAALLPPWQTPDDYRDQYFDDFSGDDETEPLTPWTEALPERVAADDEATYLRLQGTYAAAVSYFDAGVATLLGELEDRQLLEEMLLLVTTDRGWPLGEHGAVGTRSAGLYEELLHLPLLIRLPGGEQAGRRIAAFTQPVDVMPTLLEAFGASAPTVHGASLWPLLRGKETRVRAYACSGISSGLAVEWSLRTSAWSLRISTEQRQPQFFVKPDDRWEVNDLYQHHHELAEALEKTLHAFVAATRLPGSLHAPELPVPEWEEPDPAEEEPLS